MALDLNMPLDEGDEQVPDLNEAVAREEEIHVDHDNDQLRGNVQGGANHVLPFDLNLDAPGHQGEMHPGGDKKSKIVVTL
uniref:Uncharacterized protein n=1 Tax=Oryza punctata TaxID=4537 RepID=A0A0E0K039_ORYPU